MGVLARPPYPLRKQISRLGTRWKCWVYIVFSVVPYYQRTIQVISVLDETPSYTMRVTYFENDSNGFEMV